MDAVDGLGSLGGRLREARENLGLTQADVGESIGVNKQTVHRWEVGAAVPKIRHIIDLTEILGVTLDWLATGELP